MLERLLAAPSRWLLDHVEPKWVDYVVSSTMTDFNRWFNGFLWTYDLKALVESIEDEAPGVKTFVLRPNQHWRGFEPGQHIEIEVLINGQVQRRCYSPSPRPQGRVSITVKRKAGGHVSNWLHDHLRTGMQVGMKHPRGRFTWQGQRKLLMLCAGSGITPCHAMVASMLLRPLDQRPDVRVMAQFRDASQVIFRGHLHGWRTQGVPVTVALSGETGEAGRLNAQRILHDCPDVNERDIYLCGPTGFMAQMIDELKSLGVDPKRVHTERFEMAPPQPVEGGAFNVDGAQVFFEHVNARLTLTAADQGKTLLQLAQDHGVNLESGCGQGACGTCKLTVHDGQACGNVMGTTVYLCTAYPGSRHLVLGA